jgi:NAD(P)-dependent dehydrogenase (short-subunit alcohol dehydrogenase family)
VIALPDQHVLITGAGGGIGRALAAAFSHAGARISAFDRDAAALPPLAAAYADAFDIRDAAATKAAVERLLKAAGTPDILVNNAGWTRAETLDGVDEDSWRDELDLNLNGAFRVTHPILARMVARRAGIILFVSSVNALQHFGNPAYAAAKAGMLAFTRAIAVEYGRHGIRANAICPGSVRTAAWEHRLAKDPGILEAASRFYPLGRIVEVAEVASAALFLCSPLASGITGIALPVDAGLTAGNAGFIRDILERDA